MKQETTTFLLHLPQPLKKRLAAAAEQDKSGMSRFVRQAIEAACAKAEEQVNNKPSRAK